MTYALLTRRHHREGSPPDPRRHRERRRRPRGGNARAGPRRRLVRGSLARRDRRATPVRCPPAHGAERQGRVTRRADHDRHADPADARAHVLRRPGRRRPRRDADRSAARRDPYRTNRAGARVGLRPRATRDRSGPPGVRRVRRDRRGEQDRGPCRRGRGRAPGHRRLPRPVRRAAPRTDASRRQGTADGRVPLGRAPPVDLDHRDRGGCRRPERDRHARRERRALRPRAAAPAAGTHRPRRPSLVLRPVRREQGGQRGGSAAPGSHGRDDRRVRARR